MTQDNTKLKYTLHPDQVYNNHLELHADGVPKFCPFQNPMMVQTKFSANPVPMHKACGTWCALFKYFDKDDENIPNRVWIECGSTLIVCDIEPEEKNKPLKLV